MTTELENIVDEMPHYSRADIEHLLGPYKFIDGDDSAFRAVCPHGHDHEYLYIDTVKRGLKCITCSRSNAQSFVRAQFEELTERPFVWNGNHYYCKDLGLRLCVGVKYKTYMWGDDIMVEMPQTKSYNKILKYIKKTENDMEIILIKASGLSKTSSDPEIKYIPHEFPQSRSSPALKARLIGIECSPNFKPRTYSNGHFNFEKFAIK